MFFLWFDFFLVSLSVILKLFVLYSKEKPKSCLIKTILLSDIQNNSVQWNLDITKG